MHILHKWNLARDYVVRDLASSDQLPRRGSMGIELPFQRYGDSTKSSDGGAEKERESMLLLRGGAEDSFRSSRSLNLMQYDHNNNTKTNNNLNHDNDTLSWRQREELRTLGLL